MFEIIVGFTIIILGAAGILIVCLVGNKAPKRDPNFDDLVEKVNTKEVGDSYDI